MPACHAGGHEFESRTHRWNLGFPPRFFCLWQINRVDKRTAACKKETK